MTSVFEFEAPQFVDFNSRLDDSDGADKFFDVGDETPQKEDNKENKHFNATIDKETVDDGRQIQKDSECSSKHNVNAVSKTPINEDVNNSNKKRREMIKATRRLSQIGMKDQTSHPLTAENKTVEDNLSKELDNISLRAKKRTHFEGIEIKTEAEKQHSMVKKSLKRKSTFQEELKPPEKYVAMAEQVLHFERDTPPRFHSHRRQSTGIIRKLFKKKQYRERTEPKLPSMRSRTVDVPSQQEREAMELEEMTRHPIKTNPLNDKKCLPPKLPPKHDKPKTAPAPFNLTQVAMKPKEVAEEPYRFTANPVPKVILERPVGIAPKKMKNPGWGYKVVKVAAVDMEFRKKDQEKAEVAKLRKEMVHKAQPMPKFKPVPLNEKVMSQQRLTMPQSPRFTKRTPTSTGCSSNQNGK